MKTLGIFKNGELVDTIKGETTYCYTLARQLYRSMEYAWRWI